MADLVVAQEGPQEVTIRDLNSYEALQSIDQISEHPLEEVEVRITAVVSSYPRSSGLSGFNSDESIGRIHFFLTDTTALSEGRDGMSIRVVQDFGDPPFSEIESNWRRGDVFILTGTLTFFRNESQFVINETEEYLGNVNDEIFGLEEYQALLEPVEVSPSDFHFETGSNEVGLDLEAYQKYNGMYVRIADGTMANYSGDTERPNFTINKDGVFTPLRDISLRFRNDTNDNYRDGYNYRRESIDGDFIRPPIGSAVNVNGFLVLNGFTEGYSFENGAGLFIAPMEDGILWQDDDTRLVNGESEGGLFEWPVDFELVAAPPQVLSVDPFDLDGGIVSPDSIITLSALTAAPEDDPSVTIDSVIVNYTTRTNGLQRLEMVEVDGNGTYEISLPELVAFESPSYFVEAYGSNGLIGRFPTTGSLSYYVDGGTITSIETIQLTGDNLEGPSPIAGIEDLDFDITATVVSTASDGLISVQEGPNPWSGVFLGLASNTAGLGRGDVINITGATVLEAELGNFNDDLSYTYLTEIVFTIEQSGTDISAVVPTITTDEFNEPIDPGEAWEGMLLRFENVRMTDDLGFGEVEFATIDSETGELLEGRSIINEDTDSGTIGETGFPDDFNLHARLGNDLASVTGIAVYNFGSANIVPRELEDISGDNYTIPRPEFNLISPADSAVVNVLDVSDIVVDWQSLNPRDYDFDTVTFEWVLYNEDLVELAALPADNDGADSQITLSAATFEGVLDDLGVMEGDGVTVNWNVRAIDASDTVAVAAFIDFDTRLPLTLYRALVLNRGEITSNEELGGLPRTFELEQNYPNPFNPTTQINYALPEQSDVRIEIYNVIGRRVATLVNREMAPGKYSVNFDASSLSSGMYFYRLKAGSTLLTKKMTLIK